MNAANSSSVSSTPLSHPSVTAVILAAGGSPAEAAVIANFAAGVEVGKLGAATVRTAEVLEAYDEFGQQGKH